jgi:hypothetical protein
MSVTLAQAARFNDSLPHLALGLRSGGRSWSIRRAANRSDQIHASRVRGRRGHQLSAAKGSEKGDALNECAIQTPPQIIVKSQ